MTKSQDTTIMTLEMMPSERDTLRDMAKAHGYVIGRGREADWGSVRQFVLAIANGELSVVKSAVNGNES